MALMVPSLAAPGDSEGSLGPRVIQRARSDSNPAQSILLWIDDEISSADPAVTFLTLQGFCVDCAITGCTGLAMARAAGYDGILLDLKLPDLPGLAILATLKAEKITTPVLILTGFGDVESARLAGRLGATGFKAKPLLLDDLEIAVRRLIKHAPEPNSEEPASLFPADADFDDSSAGLQGIASLLEQLHLSSGSGDKSHGHRADTVVGAPRDPTNAVAAILLQALANPNLPMIAFLACAAAFRNLFLDNKRGKSSLELAADTNDLILEVMARPTMRDPRVIAAIEAARSSAANNERLLLESAAVSRRVSAGHLSRLIKDDTGFDFTDWRTAFLLRASLPALLQTTEDIKQIAQAHLGYKHLSQFDHEFHRFFGVTPSRLRELYRT